ncbi:stage II sporulation protein R [Mediterraneibacter glycyrrhizinilyticus]|nr:stage II sporulation protein R [Mediterraneibacter glycyrrhizinilyticus]MBM6854339.1 stage II sporulation protein R [Mediterraneibacter glycyrrhizinilyticus]
MDFSYNTDRYKNQIIFILSVLLSVVVTGLIFCQTGAAAEAGMQQEISDEILRFHVIANSDSKEDQELKMEVRDAVAAYLVRELPEGLSLKETESWVREHTDGIEKAGREVLAEAGSNDTVNAAVTTCWFSDRTYDDLFFPAGNYRALRVEIGEAEGHNWWCVLYPGLSFGNTVNVVDEDGNREKIKNVLTEEEYSEVTATSDFKISWYFWKGK